MEWHSVKEKLPTTMEPYLIKCRGYQPRIANYIENPNCLCKDPCCKIWVVHDSKYVARLINGIVTHWAEIPNYREIK